MCFGSRDNEDAAGAARSHELDKLIRADEKRKAKEVKLLLLGTSTPPSPPANTLPSPLAHNGPLFLRCTSPFFCWALSGILSANPSFLRV